MPRGPSPELHRSWPCTLFCSRCALTFSTLVDLSGEAIRARGAGQCCERPSASQAEGRYAPSRCGTTAIARGPRGCTGTGKAAGRSTARRNVCRGAQRRGFGRQKDRGYRVPGARFERSLYPRRLRSLSRPATKSRGPVCLKSGGQSPRCRGKACA